MYEFITGVLVCCLCAPAGERAGGYKTKHAHPRRRCSTYRSKSRGAPNLFAPEMSQQQPAQPITAPTAEDLVVQDARKKVLRALDSKITQQDDPTALAAIETASKLVNNIVSNPMEPKYRKIRSNNPTFSKKVLRCPGGQDLLLALGFRTKVMEFEEMWIVEEGPVLHRTLAEGAVVLERYLELTREKIERAARQRKEKLANMNEDRLRTLQAIEDDKAERKLRETLGRGGNAGAMFHNEAAGAPGAGADDSQLSPRVIS